MTDAIQVFTTVDSEENAFPALEALVTQLHPYDIPEILAMPITAGSKPYLSWLARETPRAR